MTRLNVYHRDHNGVLGLSQGVTYTDMLIIEPVL